MANNKRWWLDSEIMGPMGMMPAQQAPVAMNNPAGINPPAGVVEAGEFVFSKPAVDEIGVDKLRKMHNEAKANMAGQMPSYRCGGKVKSYNKGGLVLKSYAEGDEVIPENQQIVGIARRPSQGGGTIPVDSMGRPVTQPAIAQNVVTSSQNIGGLAPTTQIPTRATTPSLSFSVPTSLTGAPTTQTPTTGLGGKPPVSQIPTGIQTPALNFSADNIPTAGVVGGTPPDTGAVIDKSREAMARTRGLQGLTSIASGQHPLFRTLANMAQQQIATQGAMDQASLRQEMAQMGVTGEAATAMMADLQRDIGSNQAVTAGKTAVAAQQLSAQAVKDLSTEALAGMNFELSKTREQRLADETGYANLRSQYDEAISNGDIDGAKKIWAEMRGQYPTYTSAVEPDWTKVQKTYNSERITTLNADIGKLISTGSSLPAVRGLISDSLEATSGMTIDALAAASGKTVDQLITDEYNRIKEFGGSDVERLIAKFKTDYADRFDGPGEADAVESWIKDAYYQNWFTMDENGNLTYNVDDVLLPWNAPKTAHLFDENAQQHPELMDARTTYLQSNTNPIAWDVYESKWDEWHADPAGKGTLEEWMSNAQVENQRVTKIDIGGTEFSVTENADVPGGFAASDGTPIWYDGNTPMVLDYDKYKTNNGGNVTDMDDLNYFVQRGDAGAIADYVSNFIANPSILSGVPVTDRRYQAVVNGLPAGTNAYIKEASAGDFMVRDYNGVATPLKLIKRTGNKRYAVFEVSPGRYATYDTESENWTAEVDFIP